MRDRKISFRVFTVPEWKKEQEYLRKQHKRGWKFTKVNFGICYHFEKCEPEDVVYQLDYNQDGLAHKDEYVQMYEDCGWEYIMDFVGYSYFRKPVSQMNGKEEIFCDNDSKLEMMNRVYKGRILPLLISFFLIAIPQFMNNAFSLYNYKAATVFGLLIIFFILVFTVCIVKYNKYKKRVGK